MSDSLQLPASAETNPVSVTSPDVRLGADGCKRFAGRDYGEGAPTLGSLNGAWQTCGVAPRSGNSRLVAVEGAHVEGDGSPWSTSQAEEFL